MFLSKFVLNKKKLFLDLSIYAAMSNGIFEDKEKLIIEEYCFEMSLDCNNYAPNKDLDVVLEELKNECTPEEISIIMIEILALIMGDGLYDDLEKDFMKKVQTEFALSDEKIKKAYEAIKELLVVYEKLNEIIIN